MRHEVFNINNMQMENLNEKERVFNYAKELKMPVLRDELDDFITLATDENWSHRTLVCRLLAREMEVRIESRRKQRVRIAGFPELKYLQELVREELPKDAQTALPELETLEFIKEGRNIVFCGNPGTGKTHLSIGLGIKACLEGYTFFFTSVPHLLTQIRECRSQKSLEQPELRFQKYDMVICDEFGYVSYDKEGGDFYLIIYRSALARKQLLLLQNWLLEGGVR